MPGTDGFAIRMPRVMWFQPASLVVLGLARLARDDGRQWLGVALLAVGVVTAVVYARQHTTATPEGLIVCNGFRATRLAWTDVVRVEGARRGARAVTNAGRQVVLPQVLFDAAVPVQYVKARSAQRLVEYAREHGHDVGYGAP